MVFCPKCGLKNRKTYNFCSNGGTKIKYTIEDIKPTSKKVTEYKINEYITFENKLI